MRFVASDQSPLAGKCNIILLLCLDGLRIPSVNQCASGARSLINRVPGQVGPGAHMYGLATTRDEDCIGVIYRIAIRIEIK